MLGLLLLALEIKVTSYGLLTAGGLVSLLFGAMMLIDAPEPELRLSFRFVLPVVLGFAGIGLFLVRLAVIAQRSASGLGRRGIDRSGRRSPDGDRAGPAGTGARARGDLARAVGRAGRPGRARACVESRRVNGHRSKGVRCFQCTVSPALIVILIVVLYLISSVKILAEYERGVIFRLGKLLDRAKGPGIILVFKPIDRMVRVTLRTVVHDVPPQDVITRDNVSVKVNAVVYFRVVDSRRAIVEVEDYKYATSQLAQTTLRSVLGQVELDDLLSQRERLNQQLQHILDEATDVWGIKVSAVEVKHVDLPPDMQRAIARQAEAEREKRAKIIHAAGELEASAKLAEAAAVIAAEPVAVTLRYLQTLTEIAAEKNSTIVFPLPIDLLTLLRQLTSGTEPHTGSRS